MATTLSYLEKFVLRLLDEPDINNCSYKSIETNPYTFVDEMLNDGEQMVGSDIMVRGCKPSIEVRSSTVTFPSESENVAWSTLDSTGALPGTKIEQIWDLTSGTSSTTKFRIPIVNPEDIDKYVPAIFSMTNRWGMPRGYSGGPVAALFGDRISIMPILGCSRSIEFIYIPAYGKMHSGLKSVTVTAGGTGYSSAPTVSFTANAADTFASGATATATLTGGVVTSVTVTNAGSGYYNAPTVVFSTGAATATAAVGSDLALPDSAAGLVALHAAQKLMRYKGREASDLVKMYDDELKNLVQLLWETML